MHLTTFSPFPCHCCCIIILPPFRLMQEKVRVNAPERGRRRRPSEGALTLTFSCIRPGWRQGNSVSHCLPASIWIWIRIGVVFAFGCLTADEQAGLFRPGFAIKTRILKTQPDRLLMQSIWLAPFCVGQIQSGPSPIDGVSPTGFEHSASECNK